MTSHDDGGLDGNSFYYRAIIKDIYTGEDDMKEGENAVIDETPYEFAGGLVRSPATDLVNDVGDAIGTAVKTAKNLKEDLSNFKENFQHNPGGTLATLFFDFIRFLFGDFPQFLANLIQTPTDGSFLNMTYWKYMYSKSDLEKDENVNKYTNVQEYKKENTESTENTEKIEEAQETDDNSEEENWQKVITIEKEDENDERFSEDTKIPVMIGDIYNVAVGHIDLFDVNFLIADENPNSFWLVMRNIAAGLIHISIYISSAILLITLFIYGIQIVTHSFDDPEGEADAKERLERFSRSVATLVSSILIMALCIYGSDTFFKSIENRENIELPIRVNVEGAGYSFSTTATGYIRYMAGIEDVDQAVEKGLYTLTFIVLAIANLAIVVLMIVRTLMLWALSMIGPISAALEVFNIEGIISFRRWITLYIAISLIQVGLSFLYALILNYSIL